MSFLFKNIYTVYCIMAVMAFGAFGFIVLHEFILKNFKFLLRTFLIVIGSVGFYAFIEYAEPPLEYLCFAFAGLVYLGIFWPFNSNFGKSETVCELAGFKWDKNDFCRGWLITGRTGSGKTASAIHQIMHQLFKNCPDWGGVAVDPKGDFHEIVTEMAEYYGLSDKLVTLRVKPPSAPKGWKPEIKYNLLSYPGIKRSSYAKLIVDTAAAVQGAKNTNEFFKTQAQIFIQSAMVLLDVIKDTRQKTAFWSWAKDFLTEEQISLVNNFPGYVSMKNIFDVLTDKEKLEQIIMVFSSFLAHLNSKSLAVSYEDKESFDNDYKNDLNNIIGELKTKYLDQPEEQLGGVMSTVINYLMFFTEEDVAEVFCAKEEDNGTDFTDIDKGKIFTIAVPQKYNVQRIYIATFMKLLFYRHAMNRFDLPRDEQQKKNLIVFWADEAQNVVTDSGPNGDSDFNTVDKIRAAKATVVFATQSMTSLVPPHEKKDNAKVLILNLSNQIFFVEPSGESAKEAAELIGKHEVEKKTRSVSAGKTSYSYRKEEEYRIKPSELMDLKKFCCVIRHCEGQFKKTKIPPITTDGKTPEWYGMKKFFARKKKAEEVELQNS